MDQDIIDALLRERAAYAGRVAQVDVQLAHYGYEPPAVLEQANAAEPPAVLEQANAAEPPADLEQATGAAAARAADDAPAPETATAAPRSTRAAKAEK